MTKPSLAGADIWKVFGPRQDRAIELALAGHTRAEVQAEVGATIGVRAVDFDVSPGETFVIMGLSGSGKSTLLRCVAQLVEVTRGTVWLDDDDITAMSRRDLREVRRQKMSMVFQHFGLFPHRRVIDNVAYGLEVCGVDRSERHRRARDTLELVGLDGWEDHYPSQLSGGMQQRVGLARALVVDPTILFFDEPFSALDPLIRRDMQDELLRIRSDLGATIVFVTHDFDEALKLGDRIAVMKDGEFDQIGTPEALITSPATEYVAEFVKDVPRAKVLTAHSVTDTTSRRADRWIDASVTLEEVLPALIDSDAPLGVTSDGEAIGVIDRAAVLELL